jgi:hypothetical protein
VQARPSGAAAVAVATPCWPAPVSATTRSSPCAGEQALAEGVVDLVRAGVQQVLALEVDRAPPRWARQPLGEIERRRPAGVVGEQRRELLAEGPVASLARS